ncbi:MAG: biotin--[acetyl-CoA-carboxylase] ligase, partial [Anaerolineales bacterium]
MYQNELEKLLSNLPLGDIKYFDSIGSTNDEALAWAANDAKDLSLVIADEQTAGRGRLDRKWSTPPGTALAFSLILRPTVYEKPHLSRAVGWAALAVADSLWTRQLTPQIKWPNDVLLLGRKV